MFFNPHWILGGVDTYFYRMICWLADKGYETYLVLPKKAPIEEKFMEDVKQTGVRVMKCIERYDISDAVKPTSVKLDISADRTIYFMSARFCKNFLMTSQTSHTSPSLSSKCSGRHNIPSNILSDTANI